MSNKRPEQEPVLSQPHAKRKRRQPWNKPLKYPNAYQPRRPIYDHEGKELFFRTHISKPNSEYDLFSMSNIICQTKLYRWVKGNFVNGTPAAELHAHLFWDKPIVSKRHLGSTILQAVAYDPRKVKGKTKDNPRACMTYTFYHPKDLEYGLEWMICIWLRRVTLANSAEEMEAALTELTDATDDELTSLFWEPMTQQVVRDSIREFNWKALWAEHELTRQYEIRDPKLRPKPRPVLRSLLAK